MRTMINIRINKPMLYTYMLLRWVLGIDWQWLLRRSWICEVVD